MKRRILAIFLLGGVVFGYGSAMHHVFGRWHDHGGCPHGGGHHEEAAPAPPPVAP